MNDKIVELFPKKETPSLTGKALCMGCKHEWVAVSPAGTVWLQCLGCNLLKGLYVFPVGPPETYWQCQCGNNLFYSNTDGIHCPNCGVTQRGF